MVAVMLCYNRLETTDYPDDSEAAQSPLVESLRRRISCVEDTQMTADYHDPALRTIPNALTVTLKDGTVLEEVLVDAPLGHRNRREEAKPVIVEKFKRHLTPHFSESHVKSLVDLGLDHEKLINTDVDTYVDMYVKK